MDEAPPPQRMEEQESPWPALREAYWEPNFAFLGLVFTISILTFWSWSVGMGGLAAMQAACHAATTSGLGTGAGGLAGARGLIPLLLPCADVFRFHWWSLAFQVFVMGLLGWCSLTGVATNMRASWVGLLTISATQYIQMADTFMAVRHLPAYGEGFRAARARAACGGCIAVATLDMLLIFLIGCNIDQWAIDNEEWQEKQEAQEKARTAEAAAAAAEAAAAEQREAEELAAATAAMEAAAAAAERGGAGMSEEEQVAAAVAAVAAAQRAEELAAIRRARQQ